MTSPLSWQWCSIHLEYVIEVLREEFHFTKVNIKNIKCVGTKKIAQAM
jgi:hypothetical protein